MKSLGNVAADPFVIGHGITFSASGGSAGASSSSVMRSRILAEMREAEHIINRFHVDGRRIETSSLSSAAVNGMLRSLDPHSHFYNPLEWKDLLDEQQSSYAGIGATITNFRSGSTTETYVLSVVPGSPAERGRLHFGDRIIAVDSEKMANRDSEEVRDKIRGPAGTMLSLTVERAGTRQIEQIQVRRAELKHPSVPYAHLLKPGVGYIALTEGFTYSTSAEFRTALLNLKQLGMNSLVVDLRGNRGGIVEQAVKVAETFLPSGTLILTQRGRSGADNRVYRSSSLRPETMPLVLLVDADTASAAEIVAGAFQDNDRALIAGEKTFGKGLVQSVIDLPGSSGLTLTTARYLTPAGRSIQRDYSKVDLYDYFANRSVSAAIDRPYFEARTPTNRRLLGGDGILPDEIVPSKDITIVQASLLDSLFFFAREVVAERPVVATGHPLSWTSLQKRIAPTDVFVSDDLVSAFETFALRNANGKVDLHTLRSETGFIRLRMRHNLALAAHDVNTAHRLLIENDPRVVRAIQALPRSAELARLAGTAHKRQ
ncbi:MAG: S41 family peptidase [Pyrinomonadaceae bacterium]